MRLGSLELGAIPRVAACFTDAADEQQIAAVRNAGIDIAELRIDRFRSRDAGHVGSVLARFSGFPTIGTIRVKAEGGDWGGDERERLSLYRSILPRVDAIDVELRSSELLAQLAPEARATDKRLIVSHHDFAATPDGDALDRIREDARAAGADIVKISTQVTTPQQIRDLCTFCAEHPETPMIVIGMGARGLPTRLLLPALGSLIAFSSIGEPTGPGQLPFDQMLDWMRRLYPDLDAEKRSGDSSQEGG